VLEVEVFVFVVLVHPHAEEAGVTGEAVGAVGTAVPVVTAVAGGEGEHGEEECHEHVPGGVTAGFHRALMLVSVSMWERRGYRTTVIFRVAVWPACSRRTRYMPGARRLTSRVASCSPS